MSASSVKYTVLITKDPEEKGVYNASVAALPGCHTWGRTRREALQHAKEAIQAYVESLREHGQRAPKDVVCSLVEVTP